MLRISLGPGAAAGGQQSPSPSIPTAFAVGAAAAVENGPVDLLDAGAELVDTKDDAGKRRRMLRGVLRRAAKAADAVQVESSAGMTDRWMGGERTGRRLAGRFGRIRGRVAAPAMGCVLCHVWFARARCPPAGEWWKISGNRVPGAGFVCVFLVVLRLV